MESPRPLGGQARTLVLQVWGWSGGRSEPNRAEGGGSDPPVWYGVEEGDVQQAHPSGARPLAALGPAQRRATEHEWAGGLQAHNTPWAKPSSFCKHVQHCRPPWQEHPRGLASRHQIWGVARADASLDHRGEYMCAGHCSPPGPRPPAPGRAASRQ
ncbi:hypothetical protein H8959_002706 [Pygathrix nigripes]